VRKSQDRCIIPLQECHQTSLWALICVTFSQVFQVNIGTGCDLAVGQHTLRLLAIINLVNRAFEPTIAPLTKPHVYSLLTLRPEADCKRYQALCVAGRGTKVLQQK
jgi:hypothetical protein